MKKVLLAAILIFILLSFIVMFMSGCIEPEPKPPDYNDLPDDRERQRYDIPLEP